LETKNTYQVGDAFGMNCECITHFKIVVVLTSLQRRLQLYFIIITFRTISGKNFFWNFYQNTELYRQN